ncbi:putative methyltransferase DDB_G0268948 isoform X3 [Mustelus asterias]
MAVYFFEEPEHAARYQKYRPSTPSQLQEGLASHFDKVVGIDLSEAQIEEARKMDGPDNVSYRQGVAEEMKFEDGSVDLVTVGAAAHWFDMEKFMKELARILKPHGCVALYCYEVPHLLGYDHCSDHPTQIVQDLFTILKPYETEVNSIVWNEYKEVFDAITFPDKERAEDIYVKLKKSISWFIRYLNSSVLYQSYQKEDPENAKASLEKVEQRLLNALGVSSETVVEFSMKYFCVLASKPE